MTQSVHNPEMVFCSKCGMLNPGKNKHCYGCGESLFAITCSYCSTVNPHQASFCGMCGKKLPKNQ